MSDNVVCAVYKPYSSSSSVSLYAIVFIVDGVNISVGTPVEITTTGSSIDQFNIVALSPLKAMIVNIHSAFIITVSDTTITVGTKYTIKSDAPYNPSIIKLTENKVVVICSKVSSSKDALCAVVCTINDTIITSGTLTEILKSSSFNYGGHLTGGVALSKSKVLISYTYSGSLSYFWIHAIVCNISGTTITKGTDTNITNKNYAGYSNITPVLLSNGTIVFAHLGNLTSDSLYATACFISDTKITVGTTTELLSTATKATNSTVTINDDVYIISLCSTNSGSSDSNDIVLTKITLEGLNISVNSQKIITFGYTQHNLGLSIHCLNRSNDLCIVYEGSGLYRLGTIIVDNIKEVSNFILPVDKIAGVANTSGTEGETIEVYVPEEVSV